MKVLAYVVFGTDNFSYETYLHSMHKTYEQAKAKKDSIKPNGTLPDTYEIRTITQDSLSTLQSNHRTMIERFIS